MDKKFLINAVTTTAAVLATIWVLRKVSFTNGLINSALGTNA